MRRACGVQRHRGRCGVRRTHHGPHDRRRSRRACAHRRTQGAERGTCPQEPETHGTRPEMVVSDRRRQGGPRRTRRRRCPHHGHARAGTRLRQPHPPPPFRRPDMRLRPQRQPVGIGGQRHSRQGVRRRPFDGDNEARHGGPRGRRQTQFRDAGTYGISRIRTQMRPIVPTAAARIGCMHWSRRKSSGAKDDRHTARHRSPGVRYSGRRTRIISPSIRYGIYAEVRQSQKDPPTPMSSDCRAPARCTLSHPPIRRTRCTLSRGYCFPLPDPELW